MCMGYGISFPLQFYHGALDGSISTTPAQYQEVALVRTAIQLLQRDIVGDLIYFLLADLYHQLVILRIVAYIPRDILFFHPPDPMLQSRTAVNGPCADEFLFAQIR